MQLRYLPVVLTVALTGCGDGGGDTTVETPEATSPSLIDPPNDPVTSFIAPADAASPVSYTHLTLPTIYSV